jgi:hypothetical protein
VQQGRAICSSFGGLGFFQLSRVMNKKKTIKEAVRDLEQSFELEPTGPAPEG